MTHNKETSENASDSQSMATRSLVGGCIVIHVLLICWQIIGNSPTRNEIAHVPAGVANLQTGQFHLYRVNPPLSRLLQAAPVLACGPETEELLQLDEQRGIRAEWTAAAKFADQNSDRYRQLMAIARFPGILWSLLGLFLLRRWCRELYGLKAANMATVIWCFAPNVLAHAALATPDFPCAVSVLWASYQFCVYWRDTTFSNAFNAGLVLGIAQLTKFTALVLYPVWGLIVLFWLIRGHANIKRSRLIQHAAVAVLLSLAIINLGYLCEGTFTRLGDFDFASQSLSENREGLRENRFSGTWMGKLVVPLPMNFVRGMDLQQLDFEKGKIDSYLRGEYRKSGWWYFYLYAGLVKIPVATLILGLAGLSLAVFQPWRTRFELLVWAPCLAIVLVASCKTGFTLHFRYVLPALPLALVGLSKLGELTSGFLNWSVRILVCGSLVSSLLVAPHWLAYFNLPAGGPGNGSRHLIDSNLDWGQDLYRLKSWIHNHPDARPLFVGYVNYVPYDLELPENQQIVIQNGEIEPGWYAVDTDFQFNRLRNIFQTLTPIQRIGYSIQVFYIDPSSASESNRVHRNKQRKRHESQRPFPN